MLNFLDPFLPKVRNPLCFWSNLFMLVPAAVAYRLYMPYTSAVLLLAMGCSMFYHMDEEHPHGLYVDLAGVMLLAGCMIFMVMQSAYVFTYANILAVVYANMAFWCYCTANKYDEEGNKDMSHYEKHHTAWHVLVVCSMMAAIYSHASSTFYNDRTPLTDRIKIRYMSIPSRFRAMLDRHGSAEIIADFMQGKIRPSFLTRVSLASNDKPSGVASDSDSDVQSAPPAQLLKLTDVPPPETYVRERDFEGLAPECVGKMAVESSGPGAELSNSGSTPSPAQVR